MPESHNGSFSYESPTRQRRNALKVLFIELIIFVFLVFIIVIILSYMKVISFDQLFASFNWFQEPDSSKEIIKKDIVVPAQKGYGPNDDSSGWVEPDWIEGLQP